MPFADDVRKYTFPSLDRLVNKKGEVVTEHPYLPTEEQLDAMDNFVDAMDVMAAGEKDEEGYVIHISRPQIFTSELGTENHGSTHGIPITRRFIASNKPCFIVQLFPI